MVGLVSYLVLVVGALKGNAVYELSCSWQSMCVQLQQPCFGGRCGFIFIDNEKYFEVLQGSRIGKDNGSSGNKNF